MMGIAHSRGIRAALAVALLGVISCAEPLATGLQRDALRADKLLECPGGNGESVAALLTPLGGVLSLGGHRVQIPGGALLQATVITMRVPPSRYAKVEISAKGIEHFVFERPISVTIDYSRCTVSDDTQLGVWYVDDQTNDLLEFMGGSDDRAARRVTFTTPHLSAYALAD